MLSLPWMARMAGGLRAPARPGLGMVEDMAAAGALVVVAAAATVVETAMVVVAAAAAESAGVGAEGH